MAERIVFQTQDQVAIVSTFVTAIQPRGAVLLLHMMPADRASWSAFQQALADRGLSSLAIDLRGHGESTIKDGYTIDYRSFRDADHQASSEDIASALRWLASRGFPSDRVAIAGASIGANLALATAADHPEIPAVALLSPGESYRGVETFGPASRLTEAQALWAAASQGDDQESFDAAKEIVSRAACQEKIFQPYTSSGHGTNLFVTHPDAVGALASWFAERFA